MIGDQFVTIGIGINGFGRMGRLALRVARSFPGWRVTHINEVGGDSAAAAHLFKYDSQHGTWHENVEASGNEIRIDGTSISYSRNERISSTDWTKAGAEIVVECTGKFKSADLLSEYLSNGVKKVIVAAPVKDGTLNIVMGVNDHLYDSSKHHIVTAASCTTNCIAPVIKVVHEQFGIAHGAILTVHDVTNTQSVLDQYHKDLRRARASAMSLIPTSTGSATAIAEIFPELRGKLNGMAVRVPLANASVTDCGFELETSANAAEVNAALERAANSLPLKGILGFETLPLVSCDYEGDKRSAIVDANSTMVIDETFLKVLVWYDNEIGYVNRMVELTQKVADGLSA